MKLRALLLVLILVGLLAAMGGLRALTAPPRLRASNNATQFDAIQAKTRLARLLGDQQPHPMDSPANDAFRARLITELRSLGLQPRVETQFVCNSRPNGSSVECGRVANVLATMGPATGKHVLLVSHYDSVPVGPGAGDDGIGVASMLEVAAQLRGSPLARPVSFLFDEGEEAGLLGARAFLAGDPLRDKVDALVNVEARGVSGPVSMFETSEPNRAAIALYGRAVRTPSANSLAVSAYRSLPNSTDVNVFAPRHWLTLNFAPTGNETRYHSAGDDLAALNPATLQHMGDQLLDVTRLLAAGPTPAPRAGETLFMDLLGRGFVSLPAWLGWILLGAATLFLAFTTFRRAALSRGAPALLAAMLAGGVLAWAGLAVVGILRPGQFWRAHQGYNEIAVYAGIAAAALVMLVSVPRLSVAQWRPAFWLMFCLIGIAVGFAAPGGVVYFLAPTLIAVAGMIAERWWRPAETIAALLAALLLLLTMGAMLGLLAELFNSGPLWILAVPGALIMLPWLIELRPVVNGFPARTMQVCAGAMWIAGWGVAAAQPAYSSDRQQAWTLEHVTDRRDGKTRWNIVNDTRPLPESFAAFGPWALTKQPYSSRPRWQAKAAATSAPAPSVRILDQAKDGATRRLRLQLASGGADTLLLQLPPGAGLREAGLNGRLRLVGRKPGRTAVSCTGRACDDAIIELLLDNQKPVGATLIGRRYGLPATAQPLLERRPVNARPQYTPDSTVTLTRVTL